MLPENVALEITESTTTALHCKKMILFKSGLFFHRFLGNTNKWICRILEFRKKCLSLEKKSLSLGGKALIFKEIFIINLKKLF